jgi:hypothetical protein
MSTGRVAAHGHPPNAMYQNYLPTQQHYQSTEVVQEMPYYGEQQHYGGGGMDMPGMHGGGMAYDPMANSSAYHGNMGMMVQGGPRAASNYYSPAPNVGQSCGPKKEFERVLLNPQSVTCSKPITTSVPASCPPPSCDNSCHSAQFVLESASNGY